MALRSRRKRIRNLADGKTVVSRAAKKLGVPALKIVNDEICTEGLEKEVVLPVRPKSRYPPHLVLLDGSNRNTMNSWNQKA